jgi:hypothetical protein
MKKYFSLFVSVLILFVLSATGHSAILTEIGSLDWVRTDQETTINVNQFDPSMGTLNSAKFTLQGDLKGSYIFQPTSNSTLYWAERSDVKISYGNLMNLYKQVNNPDPWPELDELTWKNINSIKVLKDDKVAGDTISLSITKSYEFTAFDTLNLFKGKGTIPFSFDNQTMINFAFTGGNGTCQFETLTSGKVTAEYNYTPVPILAGFWLLGSGLIGLAGFRRKILK